MTERTDQLTSRRIARHGAVLAGLWLMFGLVQVLSPLLVPARFFCYRAWECVLNPDELFQPWARWEGQATGDLSNMAGVPQLKRRHRQLFTTDEYGFRNPPGQLDRRPELVVVGDSFAAGAPVSNDELLEAMVARRTGLVTYNYATLRLRSFYQNERFRQHPPRWVVAFHVERELEPALFELPPGDRPFAPRRYSDRAAYDRESELGWRRRWKQMRENIVRHSLLTYYGERALKGGLWALGLYEFPDKIYAYDRDSGFLFYEPAARHHLDPSKKLAALDATVAAIRDVDRRLAARGTRLIVLIAPDKENIYRERIPSLRDRPAGVLLEKLEAELSRYGVLQVPAYRALADYHARHPEVDLYFPDDTHLTPAGHEVLLERLLQVLQPSSNPLD